MTEQREQEFDDYIDETHEPIVIGGVTIGNASKVLFETSPIDYRIQLGEFHQRECEDGKHVPDENDPHFCEWCSEPLDDHECKECAE